VSRKSRERRLEAEERWPTLSRFLGSYLHEDWPIHSGTPEKAVDEAVSVADFELRRRLLKEWRDWNNVRGCQSDIAVSINDGLGVNVYFEDEVDARSFMNSVYEKLIVAVRAEADEARKPEYLRGTDDGLS
jgi:hypothetical protein